MSDEDVFMYFSLAIMIIVIVFLLIYFIRKIKIDGEDYYQRRTRLHFNNLFGEEFGEDAKMVLEYGNDIPNPRAIDNYRIGTVHLFNAGDAHAAHRHFTTALNQIIRGEVDTREAPFIIERIDDFQDRLIEVDELPLQQALMRLFEIQREQIGATKRHIELNKDDPEIKQKTLLAKQTWFSDSQNVHDTALYKELADQIKRVRDDNLNQEGSRYHDYAEVKKWMIDNARDKAAMYGLSSGYNMNGNSMNRGNGNNMNGSNTDEEDENNELYKIEKVFKLIDSNYLVEFLIDLHEQDVLVAVWQRSFYSNQKIQQALYQALLDCIEHDDVVCKVGRVMKIWQSLALLDKDPSIGVFNSKQMMRNELYERAAAIINSRVGSDGSESADVKKRYLAGDNSEDIKQLKSAMIKEIEMLKKDYFNKLDDSAINTIIDECKAIV